MSGQEYGAEAGGCCEACGGGNGRGGCCGGPRGCCHDCFAKGFDEDAWDKKDEETRKKRTAANQAQSTQPASTPQMTAPAAKDTNATE
ncbi:hypothetical protein FRC09_009720 [Ceratobasidium sp. 395]|nr:hypothetical protein FRC09_009720 [Ceratobasidium sp. 395]